MQTDSNLADAITTLCEKNLLDDKTKQCDEKSRQVLNELDMEKFQDARQPNFDMR